MLNGRYFNLKNEPLLTVYTLFQFSGLKFTEFRVFSQRDNVRLVFQTLKRLKRCEKKF